MKETKSQNNFLSDNADGLAQREGKYVKIKNIFEKILNFFSDEQISFTVEIPDFKSKPDTIDMPDLESKNLLHKETIKDLKC